MPVLYAKQKDQDDFKLEQVPDMVTALVDQDEHESRDTENLTLNSRPFKQGSQSTAHLA